MSVLIWTLEHKRNVARARRLLAEGAARLIAQQKRIKRLRAGGHYTGDARRLLDALEDTQLAVYAQLAYRERHLRR